MNSELLEKARAFEKEGISRILEEERPAFHLTGGCGWINDPNGLSYYKGEYHLFYQYHPYSNEWGPMHWGHAKSKDMLTWERIPAAMAPDHVYDNFGCFSGSALELADGRHLLMYTGVQTIPDTGAGESGRQTQCLAFGDGVNYEKYEGNPVIQPETLPAGSSTVDFRDPKIWQEADGTYYVVVAGMKEDGNGQIVLYKSANALNWEFCGVIAESSRQLGGMWECPDLYELDGKYALLVSPMELLPDGKDFHVGHGTLAMIGEFDKENSQFHKETKQPIDWGIDFYAPQSILTPDGRRVMIGWMQAWPNSKFVPKGAKYFGQLTVPREMHIRDGKLIQNPIKELENYRGEKVLYENVTVKDQELTLDSVEGRMLDITVTVKNLSELKKLSIFVAANEEYHTEISYIPEKELLHMDRSFSGYLYDILHSRDIPVETKDGQLKLRFVMDRYSLEVFINDGEKAGTVVLFTPQEAKGIIFRAEGTVQLDVEKYELRF